MIKNILAIALLFISYFSYAQDDMAKAAWVAAPVVIDGRPNEWKLPLRYYDSGIKLFFAFANDDKNLYLCFQAPDEMNQTKIMRGGMEVTLSGKGIHKVSINFPLTPGSTHTGSGSSGQPTFDRQEKRTSFILQNTMMEVKGFATRDGMIPINDSSGINAAINWDDNDRLTYEIGIPLKEWLGANYTAADVAKNITVDIEVKPLKFPSHSGGVASSAGSGFSGGGRGRQHSGGNHEKSDNSDDDDSLMPGENRMLLYQKSKLKEKFVLAQSAANP